MKITLELDDDQCCIEKKDKNSSVWIFKLNGHRFPNEGSYVTLDEAHSIAHKLVRIEEQFEQYKYT